MNESEEVFVAFCKQREWPINRLSPPGPDFRLALANGSYLVVEVKEYPPNREEKAAARASERSASRVRGYETDPPVIYGTSPGKRVRKKIRIANRQFKAYGGQAPTMLVTYNLTINRQYDSAYDVMVAMRGYDTIPIAIPKTPRGRAVSGPTYPGRGKMMTADWNTSTSAIGVLRKFWPLPEFLSESPPIEGPQFNLIVYHNRFAEHPLDPSLLVHPDVKHFWMTEDQMGWQKHPPRKKQSRR